MLRRIHQGVFCSILFLVLIAGCGTSEPAGPPCVDEDGDGFSAASPECAEGRDCDDSDPSIHPNADETCGNGIDEDCSGDDASCDMQGCTDRDGDGYGDGPACSGPDCDDEDPNRNPGKREVCGNGVDENCDGNDPACSSSCKDMDGDGWGQKGGTDGCTHDGVDCDDSNPAVHPGAEETCNSVDDNCNNVVDECPVMGATCQQTDDGMSCVSAVGARCTSEVGCGERAKCDRQVDPAECRRRRGGTCNSTDECVSDLTCHDGYCVDSYCSMQSCPLGRNYCDDTTETCVECRYWWDDMSTGAAGCGSEEVCIGKGWCAPPQTLADTSPVAPYDDVDRALLEFSKTLADCWKNLYDGGQGKDMCVGLKLDSSLPGPLTRMKLDDAWGEYDEARKNGNLTGITDAQVDELAKLLGKGTFDLSNLTWTNDPKPGTDLEYCVWFHPHGLGRSKLHVDKCDNFSF